MQPEQPDSDQLTLWRSHPCTLWVLAQVREAFPLQWTQAGSWDDHNRLKGQAEVLAVLNQMLS